MRAGASLAVRAVFAIVLMVLFYVLAVVVSAALVGLGVLLLYALPSLRNVRLMLIVLVAAGACVVAAGVVLWSIVPRLDRFTPPGPEIAPGDHPRLFAEIRAVAAATGQAMPAHVYLCSDVNAFVTQRGGLMGFGSRRVMGIGLPLLRTLQVDELRAVLAHEMGHFYGGDTRLGPWIYKTRNGLGRTVVNLARAHQATDHWIAVLFTAVQAPFRWFLLGFLRVSQAISRAQEYSADAVSVRAEGSRAVIDGLKKVHAASIAHAVYLRSEVLPLVARGALPAVGEGFSRFLAHQRFAQLLDQSVADELKDGKADPYDSHPSLRDRIAAVEALRGPERPADPRRAIELVDGAEQIETDDLASRVDRKLAPVAWTATEPLWIAAWREEVERSRPVLAELRAGAIARDPRTIYRYAARALGERLARAAEEERLVRWWISAAGGGLALMLLDAGFAFTANIAEPFRFSRGETSIEPFVELEALIGGTTSADAWRARWEALGFADQPLAAAAPPKAAAQR